jgi:putative transposase
MVERGSIPALWVLSQIGRLAVRWSHPLAGTRKTGTPSREAAGWYACCSCAEGAIQPLPPPGTETGIDVGLQVFLIIADGQVVEHPRHYRSAERALRRAQRRVARRTQGSQRRRRRTVVGGATPWPS